MSNHYIIYVNVGVINNNFHTKEKLPSKVHFEAYTNKKIVSNIFKKITEKEIEIEMKSKEYERMSSLNSLFQIDGLSTEGNRNNIINILQWDAYVSGHLCCGYLSNIYQFSRSRAYNQHGILSESLKQQLIVNSKDANITVEFIFIEFPNIMSGTFDLFVDSTLTNTKTNGKVSKLLVMLLIPLTITGIKDANSNDFGYRLLQKLLAILEVLNIQTYNFEFFDVNYTQKVYKIENENDSYQLVFLMIIDSLGEVSVRLLIDKLKDELNKEYQNRMSNLIIKILNDVIKVLPIKFDFNIVSDTNDIPLIDDDSDSELFQDQDQYLNHNISKVSSIDNFKNLCDDEPLNEPELFQCIYMDFSGANSNEYMLYDNIPSSSVKHSGKTNKFLSSTEIKNLDYNKKKDYVDTVQTSTKNNELSEEKSQLYKINSNSLQTTGNYRNGRNNQSSSSNIRRSIHDSFSIRNSDVSNIESNEINQNDMEVSSTFNNESACNINSNDANYDARIPNYDCAMNPNYDSDCSMNLENFDETILHYVD